LTTADMSKVMALHFSPLFGITFVDKLRYTYIALLSSGTLLTGSSKSYLNIFERE